MRYFGPKYSSDDAGDGPSEDEDEDDDDLSMSQSYDGSDDSKWQSDEDDQTSTGSEDSNDDSEVLWSPCLWPIQIKLDANASSWTNPDFKKFMRDLMTESFADGRADAARQSTDPSRR